METIEEIDKEVLYINDEETDYEKTDIEELDEEDIEDIEELEEENLEEEDTEEIEKISDDILDEVDNVFTNNHDDDKKYTFNILTKYEKNFIIGFRTQQIINGSPILIDINNLKEKTAYNIAKEELKLKLIPFKIKRTLPNNKVEIWDLEDMIIL